MKGTSTLVITTLDRLGRSMANMLGLSEELRDRVVKMWVLNLGEGDVDTGSPIASVMAALGRIELEIKSERISDSSLSVERQARTSAVVVSSFSDSRICSRPAPI